MSTLEDVCFREVPPYLILVLDGDMDDESEQFSNSKSSVRFCLIFCQFQPGIAYKSVNYKKTCISFKCSRKMAKINVIEKKNLVS